MDYPFHALVALPDGTVKTYPRWGNTARYVVIGRDRAGVRRGETPAVSRWCSGTEASARTEADRMTRRYGGEFHAEPVTYAEENTPDIERMNVRADFDGVVHTLTIGRQYAISGVEFANSADSPVGRADCETHVPAAAVIVSTPATCPACQQRAALAARVMADR